MNQPGSFTTLDEWLPWLETLSPREIVLGLERVQAVLATLDLPRPRTIINVAGTNGKGSSVAMLESLFLHGGRRTGCYTSPHVQRYNERIRIDGVAASDADIMRALQRVQAARADLPLTFFEFGTLAALVAFADAGVDTLLLEVGMGGRLDAVNAVDPDGCLITSIALDHMAWLGNDVESIAAEKAGIMRHAKPVVFGSQECPRAIEAQAEKCAAVLLRAGVDFSFERTHRGDGSWSWQGRRTTLTKLSAPALAGEVQYGNAAAVLALLEALGCDDLLTTAHVNRCLGRVSLAGRFQVIDARPAWVLDVAHNPAAAAVLGQSLASMAHGGRTVAVIGMLGDKNVQGMVDALSAEVDAWIAVTVAGSRATPAPVLARDIANCSGKPCLIEPRIDAALAAARARSADGDRILVAGSFYLVGPALDWLERNLARLDGRHRER